LFVPGPLKVDTVGINSLNVNMGEDSILFDYGRVYLICEKRMDKTLRALQDFIYSGSSTMCISRMHPEHLHERMPDKSIESIWLSERNGANNISPDQLNRIINRIGGFLMGKKNAVILLDGIEYLCLFNDFNKVQMFVEQINDLVMASGAILLIPLDPQSLDPLSLARIRRYAEVVQ
jgi:Protein of unknown function (DUF835)